MRCTEITRRTGCICKMHAMAGTNKCHLHTNQECVICYEKIKKFCHCPSCKTKFCSPCLDKWLKSQHTCPICRVELKAPESETFSFDNGDLETIFSWSNNESGWARFLRWYESFSGQINFEFEEEDSESDEDEVTSQLRALP